MGIPDLLNQIRDRGLTVDYEPEAGCVTVYKGREVISQISFESALVAALDRTDTQGNIKPIPDDPTDPND